MTDLTRPKGTAAGGRFMGTTAMVTAAAVSLMLAGCSSAGPRVQPQPTGPHVYAVPGAFCSAADFSPFALPTGIQSPGTSHSLDNAQGKHNVGTEYICQRQTGAAGVDPASDADAQRWVNIGVQADIYDDPAEAQAAYQDQVNPDNVDPETLRDPGSPGTKRALTISADGTDGSLYVLDGNLYLAVNFTGPSQALGNESQASAKVVAAATATMKNMLTNR